MTRRSPSRAGFTLVELLIGASLAAVLMTSVLSTYLYLGRNLARLASYQTLETESRKALSYLKKDFALAQSVKNGTTPTGNTVTLVLPSGEVVYSYDTAGHSLRRQATFGASPDLTFLRSNSCECTTFSFRYFTTTDGAPTNQVAPASNVPYSIKQIQVSFVVATPDSWSEQTRTHYQAASARVFFRNRGAPDGT